MEHLRETRSLENSVQKKFPWSVIYSWLLPDWVNSICLFSWLPQSSPKMSQLMSWDRRPCCSTTKLSLQNNILYTKRLWNEQTDVSEVSGFQGLLFYCWNSLGPQDLSQCSSSTQCPLFYVFAYLEYMWKRKVKAIIWLRRGRKKSTTYERLNFYLHFVNFLYIIIMCLK